MKTNFQKYEAVFAFVLFILFLFFAINLVNEPLGPQRNIFYDNMNDIFADFFNVLRYIAERDPYFSSPGPGFSNYLPFVYMVLYPFSQLDDFDTMTLHKAWASKLGLMSVLVFTMFSVFLLFLALNKIRKKFNVSPVIFVGFILSYLFFFTIERGNTIVLAAAFVGFFVCYYDSDKKTERIMAMLCLALATVFKIYPVLFGFLYFEKRQYREMVYSAIITLLLVFLPFLFFEREFSNIPRLFKILGMMSAPDSFEQYYPRFSLAHLVYRSCHIVRFPKELALLFGRATETVNVIISISSIALSLFTKEKWTKLSLLSMAVVFLPVASGVYNGLFFLPMIILFFATIEERKKSYNIFVIILFVGFLNPYQIMHNGSINYIIANVALMSLWVTLFAASGKEVITSLVNSGRKN